MIILLAISIFNLPIASIEEKPKKVIFFYFNVFIVTIKQCLAKVISRTTSRVRTEPITVLKTARQSVEFTPKYSANTSTLMVICVVITPSAWFTSTSIAISTLLKREKTDVKKVAAVTRPRTSLRSRTEMFCTFVVLIKITRQVTLL